MVDKIIAQDRLTQMKSRATAQLAIIDLVRSSIPTQSTGTIWEIGYGSGRTYDRLTTLFPNAPITVFDNRPDGRERVEADGNLFLEGDAFDLLPKTAADAPGTVMFMHADIGTPNFEKDIVRVGGLGTLAQQALVEGAYIASDRPIAPDEWTPVGDGLAYNWSYFLWRR
ncbi:MAG: class I SAM-dependent methyltransferase [Hyphomicrobiales bacterium]